MRRVGPIGHLGGTATFPSRLDRRRQLGQNGLGVFPADAGVGDADAVLQASLAFLGHLLVA